MPRKNRPARRAIERRSYQPPELEPTTDALARRLVALGLASPRILDISRRPSGTTAGNPQEGETAA